MPTEPTPDKWLRVAHIVRPQGHRGDVLADLLTDFPERFDEQPAVWLQAPKAEEPSRETTVEAYRIHQGRIVLTLSACTSMNDAELLRGYEVVVPLEARMPLPEDEVYIAELAGCALIDERTGATVGTVVDVDRETSNSHLLIVETDAGEEVLVPFVKAYEPRWDLAAKTLHMLLPSGLIDLSEAESVDGDTAQVKDHDTDQDAAPSARKE